MSVQVNFKKAKLFFKFHLSHGGVPELKKKMGVIDLMPVVLDILRYDVE